MKGCIDGGKVHGTDYERKKPEREIRKAQSVSLNTNGNTSDWCPSLGK